MKSTTGVGVVGQGGAFGVRGFAFLNISTGVSAEGFLGGKDPIFNGFVGVYGTSSQNGVFGRTSSNVPEDNAVYGQNDGTGHGVCGVSAKGIGVLGAGKTAGKFVGPVKVDGSVTANGNVTINGNLTMHNGGDVILADCAEEFEFSDSIIVHPGSVVVLDEMGNVRPCSKAYDKRAVGVVSGAGRFRPAIVLDRIESATDRVPIALIGKVCCKVDATVAPVEVGDLLTTSSTIGHAMKASDPTMAFGTLIGKARPTSRRL